MATLIDRSIGARGKRVPDVFLSHSSRDKDIVHRLAEDLCFLEVDPWLDIWELQPGESLSDGIAAAIEKAMFVAVILGDNYSDSRWVRDELKEALVRERRDNRVVVIPLLFGSTEVPPFLGDKVGLDFRTNYYEGLCRLAGLVHNVNRKAIEDAITVVQPQRLKDSIEVLRCCGVEPWFVVDELDWSDIKAAYAAVDKIQARNRLRRTIKLLQSEVWTDSNKSITKTAPHSASKPLRTGVVRSSELPY